MGSVKDLITDDSKAGKLYVSPTIDEFGMGAWSVSGRFSVGDLKDKIPPVEIKDKAEALTMMVGNFFEWLANNYSDIPTCYEGLMDADGNVVDTQTLLDRGDTTNIVVMKLAHVPGTYSPDIKSKSEQLEIYRKAIASGGLQCAVADVESIFRNGFPLGSSTFKKIFGAVGRANEYERIATYDETVAALDNIRNTVQVKGLGFFPDLEKLLKKSGLGETIPNPGHILNNPVYNTTTKFEASGDRDITEVDARIYSGLDEEGYNIWANEMFPKSIEAQIRYCTERGIVDIDGKGEAVTYKRKPVITDFMCTPDENREMIEVVVGKETLLIPTNKEIQRAIFRAAGIYQVIDDAKVKAEAAGDIDTWKDYVDPLCQERNIDIREVTEHSCNLMSYAIAEVANRALGKQIFDSKPIDSWVGEFVPYASRRQ